MTFGHFSVEAATFVWRKEKKQTYATNNLLRNFNG